MKSSSRTSERAGGMPLLIRQLNDRAAATRMDAAREIGQRLRNKGKAPVDLTRRLADRDELVRVEVIEALEEVGDPKTLRALRRAAHDRSPLVRSYVGPAIAALGGRREAGRLERLAAREKSAIARVGYYAALYEVGRNDAVMELVALLRNRDYRVRCAAANTLSGLANRRNASDINRALRAALRHESTVAATSSLRSSIRAIRRRLGIGVRAATGRARVLARRPSGSC